MHSEEKLEKFFEAIKTASKIYNAEKDEENFIDSVKEIFGEDLSALEEILMKDFPRQ